MRLTVKDAIATILVAAIAVPYVGYLVNGRMPFIEDARGMSGVGLVLGFTAFLFLQFGDRFGRLDKIEVTAAVVSLALGIAALVLAETVAAEVLLAVFMGSILVVWGVKLTNHAGLLHA